MTTPIGRRIAVNIPYWSKAGKTTEVFDSASRSGSRRLRAVLKALPEDYDGDFMIEIDEPSTDSSRTGSPTSGHS
jgi:hypothetical protein